MFLSCRIDIIEVRKLLKSIKYRVSEKSWGVLEKQMRSIVKLSTVLSLSAMTLLVCASGVLANTLSEVEINSLGDGYGIVLKTDEAAQMKKVVSSNDRMYIELKDVNVSENIETIYNNVANLDNVTIQPASKNDVKIVFKGKDISNSKVSFETIKTDLPMTSELPKQSIQLNAPVSSYTPVYNPDAFAVEETSQTANPELNEILTKMHVSREMLLTVKHYAKAVVRKVNAAAHGDINFATVLGILLVVGAFLFKPKSNRGSVKQERTIGLASRSNLEREIGINRNLAENMNLRSNSVPASKVGYGMRAYQQSQKNPYMTANNATNGISGIARRKPLAGSPARKTSVNAKPITRESAPLKDNLRRPVVNSPIKSQMPKMSATSSNALLTKSQTQKLTVNNSQSDLDSMKFLESITKIYEKNGRADLAKGLKDNLRKAQMSRA